MREHLARHGDVRDPSLDRAQARLMRAHVQGAKLLHAAPKDQVRAARRLLRAQARFMREAERHFRRIGARGDAGAAGINFRKARSDIRTMLRAIDYPPPVDASAPSTGQRVAPRTRRHRVASRHRRRRSDDDASGEPAPITFDPPRGYPLRWRWVSRAVVA